MSSVTMSNAMIVPSTTDVLHTIARQFDEVIVPALEGLRERSAATTMRHLLRYVGQRVELEGPLLFAEAAELRRLLGEVSGTLAGSAGLDAALGTVHAALAEQRDPAVYPGVALLGGEVARLRGAVDALLAALLALPEAQRTDATTHVHEQLRAYIGWQIRQEAKIVEPAFRGYGARR